MVDLKKSSDEEAKALAQLEEEQEDARVLYVAPLPVRHPDAMHTMLRLVFQKIKTSSSSQNDAFMGFENGCP